MDVVLIRLQRRQKRRGGLPALRFAIVALAAILFSIFGFILTAVAVVAGIYVLYSQELPPAEEIGRASVETFETTRVFDRTGKHVLYEIMDPKGGLRTEVPLSRIPEHLRNATIAMEDKTFYTAIAVEDKDLYINLGGINIEGVLRAAWGELRGEDAGGGSSIPQQLVRNVVMTQEERLQRSYIRKLREMVLAIELTRQYPGIEGRDQILEWYLNNLFYGHHAYGVEAAAQRYFNKHVGELTLAQAAMLVPLGQSPTLNPIDEPAEAKRRQEIVLDAMYLQGYITSEEAWAAKQEPLIIAPPGFDMVAPHYVVYVRDLLEEMFGSEKVYGGGLQVISAIDLEIQAKATELARKQVQALREKHNTRNAAVIVLDAKTAEIKAMVGSIDYNDESIDGQVNMAVSPRQPGSSFKPFTYATAFMQGYTPATMLMDVRTSFPDPPDPKPYVPENYSRTFHGPVLVRRALGCSYNVPAVAMLHKVGAEKVVETAHAMGITTLNEAHYGLSLTLGGSEVKLLDMVYAFSVLANGGTMLGAPVPQESLKPGHRRLNPVAILKVSDAKGKVLYQYDQPRRQEVLRPEVAFLITDILSDNRARTPAFGPDSALKLQDRPAATKTGTTDDFIDAWTVGYTPQYVTGVWVGDADREEMKHAPGSRAAGPIWHDLMEWLHDGLPVESFPRPAGLVTEVVDGVSGKLPTAYSPWRMQEIFIEGTVPTDTDDVHRPFNICKQTGKLATIYCPPDQVETVVSEIYPPKAEDWVREQGIPQPPTDFCDVHGPNLLGADVAIIAPKLFEPVRGIVPIVGNARPGGLQKYWLQYGPEMSPGSWSPIGPEHGHRVDNNILEHWDTRGLSDGLYTLQLSAVAGGGLHQASIQVLVDNVSPTVTIHPPKPAPDAEPEAAFELGKHEWINIQVDAEDNLSMEGVEFYLDDGLLGYTTVAPYTLRWTLVMSDINPSLNFDLAEPTTQVEGDKIIKREVVATEENRILTYSVQQGTAITMTKAIRGPGGLSYVMAWPSGRSITSNGAGYTETHKIHVVAYDAAGNEMKSEPVRVHVVHERKEED